LEQPPVLAVLAGSTITNTGTSEITGDVGLHPGTEFTGQGTATVYGTVYMTDAVALQAKIDLATAYNDTVGRATDETISADLGGRTLTPGVYTSTSSMAITGTLTLDAQNDPNAVFIFKVGSTLTTASASEVKLINGAQSCLIFWQMGSSATLGTDSDFAGSILASESITATTGAKIQGQLLALTGAVTLDSNIITNICVTTPAQPIKITKTVDSDEAYAGDTVTYNYLVENNGDMELRIELEDNKLGMIVEFDDEIVIAAGENETFTATYTAQSDDIGTTIVNIAVVKGWFNEDLEAYVSAMDDASISVVRRSSGGGGGGTTSNPQISIIKTASLNSAKVGDEIIYTFTVRNTGNVSLLYVKVEDNKLGLISMGSSTLDVDEQATGTKSYVVQSQDEGTTIVNIATASGTYGTSTVLDTSNASVVVVAEEIEVTPTPTPTPTPPIETEPEPELPKTGGAGLLLAISGVAIALTGGMFLKGYGRREED